MCGKATAALVRQVTRAAVSLIRRNRTLKLSRSCKRIRGVVVELAYLVAVETSISNRPALATAGGKEVRWRIVVEAHRRCTRIARSRCGRRLLPGKLALARHPLVRLGVPLDPIFKFAASFSQLLGYLCLVTCRHRPLRPV